MIIVSYRARRKYDRYTNARPNDLTNNDLTAKDGFNSMHMQQQQLLVASGSDLSIRLLPVVCARYV
jgi:hypothetical protein